MKVAVQVLADWTQLAALYTLITVGLSLVFSVMRVVNFAHAQFYVLGAYVLFVLYGENGVAFAVAVLLAGLAAALFGIAVERVVIRPLEGDEARAMIATLGVLLIMQGGALVIFGETNHYVSAPIGGGIHIAGSLISWTTIIAAVACLLICVALEATLKWSRIGLAMRAVAQNEVGARLQGVRPGVVRTAGFAIGAGLAGLAGGLILPLTAVNPNVGDPILFKMFIVIIIGGLGSIRGAVLGAFLLALIETVGVTYLGNFSVLGVYLLVIAVILVRPNGLLGSVATR